LSFQGADLEMAVQPILSGAGKQTQLIDSDGGNRA